MFFNFSLIQQIISYHKHLTLPKQSRRQAACDLLPSSPASAQLEGAFPFFAVTGLRREPILIRSSSQERATRTADHRRNERARAAPLHSGDPFSRQPPAASLTTIPSGESPRAENYGIHFFHLAGLEISGSNPVPPCFFAPGFAPSASPGFLKPSESLARAA